MLNNLFATIYEWVYYSPEFSANLFQFNLYMLIGITTGLIAIALPLIYYFFINHPRFNKIFHWLLILIISDVIIGLSTVALIEYNFQVLDITGNFTINIIEFTVINILIASVFFSLISVGIKNFSTNCSKTPF